MCVCELFSLKILCGLFSLKIMCVCVCVFFSPKICLWVLFPLKIICVCVCVVLSEGSFCVLFSLKILCLCVVVAFYEDSDNLLADNSVSTGSTQLFNSPVKFSSFSPHFITVVAVTLLKRTRTFMI